MEFFGDGTLVIVCMVHLGRFSVAFMEFVAFTIGSSFVQMAIRYDAVGSRFILYLDDGFLITSIISRLAISIMS